MTSPWPVTVDAHVRIRMADGVHVAATIHRPDLPGTFPALLEPVPYRKDDWLIPGHAPIHAAFAASGYVSVLLDIRGTGSSEGIAEDEYTEAEMTDNLAVLAWLREQPWCDGTLGMFGISWGGFAALQAAMRRPPGLKAIVPVGATHDRHALDVHYIGGTLHVNESVTWPAEMIAENALPPDPERFGPGWREEWLRRLEATPQWPLTWLRHQRRDAYWRHGSPFVDYGAIEAAVLAMNGFNDGYRDAVLELLEHLPGPRRGVLGPWGHSWPHAGWPPPSIDGIGLMTRWWDRWLKGIDNGVDREPMLAAFLAEPVTAVEYPDRMPGRWWFLDAWPPPEPPDRWLLAGDGALVATSAEAPMTGLVGDGDRAITWAGPPSVGVTAPFWAGSGPPEGLPLDQRPDEANALCWSSAPLAVDLALLGQPVAELWLSASEPVAQVAVKVADVAPDGTSALVARGLLNLTRRGGLDAAQPLVPGRVERVEVPLQACGAIVPAGHRLRVAIGGADWPLAWPPPRAATLTIRHDAAHLSSVRLPVRRGLTSDGPDLGRPAALPVLSQPLEPPGPTRSSVERQPHGGWLLSLDAEDAWHLPERDLTWSSDEHLRISIGPDDPASCHAEGRSGIRLSFGQGSTFRTAGRIVQWSDVERIHVRIELEVREDDALVHQQAWDESFARDLL
ncbi:MAG: CocE/NonD family hydrolase [Candidatus Limnocylindrales bacterium]